MLLSATISYAQNLTRNPSFESVDSASQGQGILPSEWLSAATIVPGADTYSTDGSFGLAPGAFSHFAGDIAQDGVRWVAGAWFGDGNHEAIAQLLTSSLVPLQDYHLTGFLHQDVSSGYNNSGGYELVLSPSTSASDPSAVLIGRFAATIGLDTWQARTLDFTAPVNAASLPYLILKPFSESPTLGAYPGIDNLTLTVNTQVVPAPATIYTAVEIAFPTVVGHAYQVQSTPSLDNPVWTNLGSRINGDGEEKSVFDTTRNRQKHFYRVRQVQ